MMKLTLLVAAASLIAAPAFAHGNKASHKAGAEMMKSCKQEYPDAVKGKKFKDVAKWVESEENGPNADTFKKSKCYDAHEKWESAAGKMESGENEKKD